MTIVRDSLASFPSSFITPKDEYSSTYALFKIFRKLLFLMLVRYFMFTC